MGARGKFHGLSAIKYRRKKSNPATSERKTKLVAAKVPLLTKLRAVLAAAPEVAGK